MKQGGYEKIYFFVNRLFNLSLCLVILFFSIPFFVVIACALKLYDRGPVFFRQVRLGYLKGEFVLYKFRSLVPDAERITAGNPLEAIAHRHLLVTPIGKFLRTTRLDELPQLFNILKGDMDFIGPRPQRRAFYEKMCRHIKDYDKRFNVRPGLIGYSQLFIPHSAPRRIQALIDNKFLTLKQKFLWDTYMVLLTIVNVLFKMGYHLLLHLREQASQVRSAKRYREKRAADRVRHRGVKVSVGPEVAAPVSADDPRIGSLAFRDVAYPATGTLLDISEVALLFAVDAPIAPQRFIFKMEKRHKSMFWRRVKLKTAFCLGVECRQIEHLRGKEAGDRLKYVVRYRPVSPLNYYKVQQYLLHESLIE